MAEYTMVKQKKNEACQHASGQAFFSIIVYSSIPDRHEYMSISTASTDGLPQSLPLTTRQKMGDKVQTKERVGDRPGAECQVTELLSWILTRSAFLGINVALRLYSWGLL